MEETLEYWKYTLAQFEESLQQEEAMETREDAMLKLLKFEIEYCKSKIKEFSQYD